MAKKEKAGEGSEASPQGEESAAATASPPPLEPVPVRFTAAVAGRLLQALRWLQRCTIERLADFFLARRRAKLHPSAASDSSTTGILDPLAAPDTKTAEGVGPTAAAHPDVAAAGGAGKKKKDKPRGVSLFYTKKDKPRGGSHWYPKKDKPRTEPSPQPTPAPAAAPDPAHQLQIVDGIAVPLEQELQYEEYCRRSTYCQGNSSLCHMCVFEVQRCPNGIVKNSGMIQHCVKMHEDAGIECDGEECHVRFRERSHREHRLHLHFFHKLPRGWWMKKHR